MPIFPGDPDFELETLFTVENDGFQLNKMTVGEHSGTHWGAPCHFNEGERCAEDMAAEDFFHPAAVVDARRQAAKDPDYALTVADLKRFERKHGRIPQNAIVVMWTGWQERWGDPAAYFNADAEGVLHFPGISVEATEWLIENRDLGGLGIDTLGVDPGSTRRSRRTRSSCAATASIWRTWPASSRCPRTAAGSLSAACGTRAARAPGDGVRARALSLPAAQQLVFDRHFRRS